MLSRIAARLVPFALLLGACADEPAQPAPVAAPAPDLAARPLELKGATACGIDADCDPGAFCFLGSCSAQCETGAECDSGACDARGRCTETTNKAAGGDLPAGPPNSRIAGLELINKPAVEIEVPAGDQFITVTFETSESATPQGGLSYRVESSADDSLARRVQTSNGGTTHTVVIPTGAANPEFVGDLVDVTVVTPIGTIPLILKSVLTVAGIYEGTLKLDGLGTEIPMKFGVDGDMGALGTGVSNAFLVVSAAAAEMFAPVGPSQLPGSNVTQELRAPLLYDSAIGAWVATFSYAYDIPSDQSFGTLATTQVRRELRYELKVEADRSVSGSLTDRWEGLYDGTQADGTRVIPKVQLGGTFRISKSGDQAATNATSYIAFPSTANPQLQNFALSTVCATLADATDGCAARTTFAGALSCADAVGGGAVATKTLTEVVATLLAGGLTDDGKTFKEFLAGCAAGTVAACVPTRAQMCGIELQAVAFGLSPGGYSLDKERLWDGFGNLLLEVTGGPQLGAFFVDTESRRDWLENANYGSTAITSAAAAQLNAQLMDDYIIRVLGPNVEALRTYLKPSTFAFLSRVPDSSDAIDQRDRLLIAMVGSWMATADSLSLAAQRWNEVYRLDGERRVKADEVASYLGELYRAAAIIIQLHKEAGKGAEAAPVAAGLGTLMLRYEALTHTFNELLFARDGELAISSSLDPEQASRGVLAQRREAALEAVDEASVKVDSLLQTLLDNDIRNADLFTGLDNAVNESQKRLVELCGQPVGCNVLRPADAANPLCDTSWEVAVCGFRQAKISLGNRNPYNVEGYESAAKPSEAGLAIVEIGAAARAIKKTEEAKAAFTLSTIQQTETAAAFLTSANKWNAENKKANAAIDARFEADVAAFDDRFSDREKAIRKSISEANAEISDARSGYGAEAAKTFAIRGIETAAAAASMIAGVTEDAIGGAGEAVDTTTEAASDCPDVTVGLAVRVGAAKCAVGLVGKIAAVAIKVGGRIKSALFAAKDLIVTIAQAAYAAWQEEKESRQRMEDLIAEQEVEIELMTVELESIRDPQTQLEREQFIEHTRAVAATNEAYERDLDEYEHQMDAVSDRSTELLDRELDWLARQNDLVTAKMHYYQIAESARQERATLVMRRLQRQQIAQLVAGPQAVFFAANGLAEAERELDRAKRKMNDWLVALEYAAVRPFYNERMSILLARNTYQLRAIADRLTDLEGQCGGATNVQDGTVSLRDDLLGLTTSQVDPSTGLILTPGDRFNQTLLQSSIPASRTMRYTVSETVDQVASNSALMVVNFNLGLTEFGNLRATCNAKIAGIAIKLVGDNLGSGQPYATLLYGGDSRTYSCQPGVDAYVQTFGQGDTTFGSTTSFVVAGRAASPIAGVSEMGSSNVTFAGLPLAGDYTLIIDPAAPANQAINWANLDDIELGLTFSYQDIFSSTSDCANSL
jgi:hypothetical protein